MRCIFQRFLAAFSQFSRKFPGRCEEKAKIGWKSRRIRDYSGRFGKLSKSLENRLPKRHGGSNPSSCATFTLEKPSVFKGFLYSVLFCFLSIRAKISLFPVQKCFWQFENRIFWGKMLDEKKCYNPLLRKAFSALRYPKMLEVKTFCI